MRFENDNKVLWFGMPDTPCPGETVPPDKEIYITVAVQPGDRNNKVEVSYKVNQGSPEKIVASWLRNDASANVQYFKAILPAFQIGDSIEYSAICRCAGRQVPSPVEAEKLSSSFHVVAPKEDLAVNQTKETLNTKHSANSSKTSDTTTSTETASSTVDKGGTDKTAEAGSVPQQHENRINTLNAILTAKDDQHTVKTEFLAAKGDWMATLASLKEKLSEASLQKAVLAHSLADWSEDHIPVVKTLAVEPELKNLRDVALRFNVDKLSALIDPKVVPKDITGATDNEKKRNYAVALDNKLFEKEPTAVLQRMIQDSEIPITDPNLRSGVATFLANQPDFNIRTTSIYTALKNPSAFKNINEENRMGVVEQLKTLQNVLSISPTPKTLVQLIKSNQNSVSQIAMMPKSAFMSMHGDVLDEGTAQQAYTNAINANIRNENALISTAYQGNETTMTDGQQTIGKDFIKLQKKIKYQGDISQSPISKIQLAARFPVFDYIRTDSGNDGVNINRIAMSTDRVEVDQGLSSESYSISVPTADLIGKNEKVSDFWGFTAKAFSEKKISDIAFTISIEVVTDSTIIGTSTYQAFYIIKFTKGWSRRMVEYTHDLSGASGAAPFLANNIFLINKDTYNNVYPKFNKIINRNDDWSLLSIIWPFVLEADIDPTLPMELSEATHVLLDRILEAENIESRDEAIQFIQNNFNDLFDFPILIPEIKTIEITGIFEVKTPDNASISKDDLRFYSLSLEYSSLAPNNLKVPQIVRYDWNGNNNPINENKIPFSFSEASFIILNSISGLLTISVKGFDGTVLWIKEFKPDDPILKEVIITVSQLRPVALPPAGATGATGTGKKLRGQVLELTKKCSLKDLTVVIQAKKEGDELWHVVAAANTDASANFSMPYPYGEYIKAQAIVSLTPDSPADIPIKNQGNKNETIADDFLYLLLNNPDCSECPDSTKEKDCECGTPKKAKRLPDQSDLINSDEYSQDIGGACVNLSTPNRTLSEHTYQAIVRTSDPDVANYTLKKITEPTAPWFYQPALPPFNLFGDTSPIKTRFELVTGAETVKRKPVGFDNPIRWQDAPDNNENLSLYQAVTIATGHILHYKAVTKADGYSLGNLLYSLALAPGQKKQIVQIDSAHSLQASETQNITQGESLAASLINERNITDQLGGNINEAMRGSSSASTGGVSAGLGAAASYGPFGASLGVAGGYSSSDASASQNSSRDTAMFFGEKLRQSIMQNAESYRELNATVVTSVQEGQHYAATTDVVANHNHCHALTMLYFEVLRHYAIYQELSHVEECVFVPLLMTNFTVDNIYKWNDVLASHLLPMSSNTYLQSFSFLRYRVQHPLIPAFDANERIKTNYAHVDFPKGAFCEELITSVTGYITIRVDIPRPKTVFDRVLSFPVIKREETHNANGGGIFGHIVDIAVGENNVTKKWEEKEKIANEHIIIYDNFQEAQPADVIEVVKFDNFFQKGSKDENLWKAIADLCGYDIVEDFLANYFSHKTISKWDSTFNDEIAPRVFESLLDNTISISPFSSIDFTPTAKYHGGSYLMRLNLRTNISLARNHKDLENIRINYTKTILNPLDFSAFVTFSIENVNINYTTKHYEGYIINKYIGDNLFDNDGIKNPRIATPMNSDEQRDPRKEDIYIVNKLIEHLNSNLEYYNKILWYRLDPDRRYMLLDGFGIQVYDDFGNPIPGVPGTRSLASVVKNELITVAGNSLVFPVAAGYRVSQSYIFEDKKDGVASSTEKTKLLDHYQPLTPVPPYRISVPSRGVFAEAVQGACDACEKVKEQSSQDWTKFTTDEPTPIAPIVAPTPTITDWKAAWKDFAPPLINIQNAPATPAPGAGLNGITELLGKSGVFKDITGLDATQQNVIRTYLSNQENAKAFAEMAKSMAMQEHNTQHSDSIMATANSAKASGAINQDEYGKLVKDHIQRQIDGGDSQNQQAALESKKLDTSPIKSAVDLAHQAGNKDISATESDSNGNTKTLGIKNTGDLNSISDTSSNSDSNLKYNFTVPGTVEPLQQPTPSACWATVTAMMSNWKKQQNQSVNDYIQSIGAEYVPFIQSGITIAKLTDFCKAAGFETAYSNTNFPPSYYYEKLQKNGPIWVIDLENNDPKLLHGRLLIGIKGDDSSPTTMFTIIDPATKSKYEENLPTFVSKTENVVKTLDAIKDIQIPLLIYFKQSYDQSPSSGTASNFSDTAKSDAAIGSGDQQKELPPAPPPTAIAFPPVTNMPGPAQHPALMSTCPANAFFGDPPTRKTSPTRGNLLAANEVTKRHKEIETAISAAMATRPLSATNLQHWLDGKGTELVMSSVHFKKVDSEVPTFLHGIARDAFEKGCKERLKNKAHPQGSLISASKSVGAKGPIRFLQYESGVRPSATATPLSIDLSTALGAFNIHSAIWVQATFKGTEGGVPIVGIGSDDVYEVEILKWCVQIYDVYDWNVTAATPFPVSDQQLKSLSLPLGSITVQSLGGGINMVLLKDSYFRDLEVSGLGRAFLVRSEAFEAPTTAMGKFTIKV